MIVSLGTTVGVVLEIVLEGVVGIVIIFGTSQQEHTVLRIKELIFSALDQIAATLELVLLDMGVPDAHFPLCTLGPGPVVTATVTVTVGNG